MMEGMSSVKFGVILLIIPLIGFNHLSFCDARKVLLISFQQVSHVMEQVSVAEELITRGHDVHMLLRDTYPQMDVIKKRGVKPLTYTADTVHILEKTDMQTQVFQKGFDPMDHAKPVIDFQMGECTTVLENRRLMATLKEMQFDLALVDGFLFSTCFFLIPHNLTIPYAFMLSDLPDLTVGIPNLPSMAISTIFTADFSPKSMTLYRRLKSTVHHVGGWFIYRYMAQIDSHVMNQFAPGQYNTLDIISKSVLFIGTRDHILEYPYVSLPNVVRVPGQTIRSGHPLTGEAKDIFKDAAKDGVIVMSFGSTVDDLPVELFDRFMSSFKNLPYTVIFRVSERIIKDMGASAPANVKLLKWIPQQDILAHPKTKLFITHCGNNGQYESVYHGVPMIGFPLFAEQHHNCFRMADKHLGLCLDIYDFTSNELTEKIKQVVGDEKYRLKAENLGAILKHSPPPTKTIVDALEHVMEFGGEHLRSVAHDMPLYQLLMIDMLLFIIAVILISVWLVCKFCFCIHGCLTKGKGKEKAL